MKILLSALFIMGALLVGWSVHDLITSPSADDIRRERASIAAWPSVSGDLQEVRLQQVKSTGRNRTYFEAKVRYSYLVDGVAYEGARLGVQDYREDTPEVLESRLGMFFSPANVVRRETTDNGVPIWNEKTISLQLSNQPVTVYYDPAKPASSILDPQDHRPMTSLDLIAPHLALIPIGSLMMIVSFVRWRQRPGVIVAPFCSRRPETGLTPLKGSFQQNDLRGEYWLYSEGNLKVNVGCGGISGVCHFNTSDVHLESGGPLDTSKVAEILIQLMIEFGNGRGGYKKFVLHNDGKYDLSEKHIASIKQALSTIGFTLLNNTYDKELLWMKR